MVESEGSLHQWWIVMGSLLTTKIALIFVLIVSQGCKLPQRRKKRDKINQRSLLLVSSGAWLTDMCQERYEVRENKSNKKVDRNFLRVIKRALE